MIPKKWVYLNEKLKEADIKLMMNGVHMPEFLAVALLNRRVGPNNVEDFLKKSVGKIPHPYLLKDMDKAADRIDEALKKKEKIVVYGDYDVDGITSTAMLYDFLLSEGADVSYYIPSRQDEGYGINILALQKIRKSGASLMITVDCGITASGEVEFAKTLGLDIIITDHHMCHEKIPKAVAVINPKQQDDTYPFSELAGVGVCFKLVLAMAIKLGKKASDYFGKYVDICAIGTIADVVPLTDENRIIVSAGLKRLKETNRPGLRALLSMAGLAGKELTASSVSFGIAPRINAAGRVGQVEKGVELLLETNEARAVPIADYLNRENIARQQTEKQILEDVTAMILADSNFSKRKVIVLAKEEWHPGVIGIVASRLVEKYYKPTILISIENGVGKGSGRSIEGINLFDALGNISDILLKFGGHVPLYTFSHQEGHIMAALFSSQDDFWKNGEPFLFLHLSGGTTEFLKCCYQKDGGFSSEILGGTSDISAGQLIDRVGVKMGLPFPSGRYIEEFSKKATEPYELPVNVSGNCLSFSGCEAEVFRIIERENIDLANLSKSLLMAVTKALVGVFSCLLEKLFVNHIVIAGGVASCDFVREELAKYLADCGKQVLFAQREYSSDNAAGIAALAMQRSEDNGR